MPDGPSMWANSCSLRTDELASSASPAPAAADAEISPTAGDSAARGTEASSMQHPLMTVVRSSSVDSSVWSLEADVALDAAARVREAAFTLPAESCLRSEMLATAQDWLALARLRGRRPCAGAVAQPRSA